jgi:hypothetical protein
VSATGGRRGSACANGVVCAALSVSQAITVVMNEGGVRRFYQGMTPTLFMVAPEKSLKLTVNEIMREVRGGGGLSK